MSGIQLKLTSHDLDQLIDYLFWTVADPKACGYCAEHKDKLIIASLAELLKYLQARHSRYSAVYKIKISISQGLALLVHCQRTVVQPALSDSILLNDIIGMVDQKTVSNF